MQAARYKGLPFSINSDMPNETTRTFCKLDEDGQKLIRLACEKFNLSSRSYFRILKIARTIADLDAATNISVTHLSEALQYRPKIE